MTSMPVTTVRWILRIAGIYGIIVIVPGFFSEANYSTMFPPAVNHLEFYYGFYSVTLAWQVVFLIMATDPVKYRMLLLPAMIEKSLFPGFIVWLYSTGRVSFMMLALSGVDVVLLVLFVLAFRSLRPESARA